MTSFQVVIGSMRSLWAYKGCKLIHAARVRAGLMLLKLTPNPAISQVPLFCSMIQVVCRNEP